MDKTIEWKVIEEAPEYEVSNYGDVRHYKTGILLAGSCDKNGYPRVMLCTKGPNGDYPRAKKITRFRHRLVAMAFIPNPKNLPQVNHKDENKANPYVDNLEWCSAKYNVNYGEMAIRRKENFAKINRQGYFTRGKPVYVYDYKTHDFIGKFKSMTAAAKELDCDYWTIYKLVNHEIDQHQHHGKVFSDVPLQFDN